MLAIRTNNNKVLFFLYKEQNPNIDTNRTNAPADKRKYVITGYVTVDNKWTYWYLSVIVHIAITKTATPAIWK